MSKIKIISNPYNKITVFQSWDKATSRWCAIDSTNSNSKLLCDELSGGFFPFKVKQIVDIIIAAIEKITIGDVYPFKKNSVFPYDVKITIEYHTFKK